MKTFKASFCLYLSFALLSPLLNAAESTPENSPKTCSLLLVKSSPASDDSTLSPVDFLTMAIWLNINSLDSLKLGDLLYDKNPRFQKMVHQQTKNWPQLTDENKDQFVGDFMTHQLQLWQTSSNQQRLNLKNRELRYLGFTNSTYFQENTEFAQQSQINRRLFENSLRLNFAPLQALNPATLLKIEKSLQSIKFRYVHSIATNPNKLSGIPLISDYHLGQQGLLLQPSFFSQLAAHSATIPFNILVSVDQEKESKSTYPYNSLANLELVNSEAMTEGIGLPIVSNEMDIQSLRQLQNTQTNLDPTQNDKEVAAQMRELVLTTDDTLKLITQIVKIYLIYEASWDESATLSRLESWKLNPHLSQTFIHSTIFREMGFENGFWLRIPGNVNQNALRPLPRVDL